MSGQFELNTQYSRDSMAIQSVTRSASTSMPYLSNHSLHRMRDTSEETLATMLWRIIRNRKLTIMAFTIVVVAIVGTVSVLMTPQYEAVGQVVFHREGGDVLGFKGVDTSLLEDPEDRTAIDTQIS